MAEIANCAQQHCATTNLQSSIFNLQFNKKERIVSQKVIDELFSGAGSQSLVAFPIRVVYKAGTKTAILISVPKRRFKHAVDRNRVKRQIREAYRLNKNILLSKMPSDHGIEAAFIWLADNHLPSAVVEKRIKSLLERMARAFSRSEDS